MRTLKTLNGRLRVKKLIKYLKNRNKSTLFPSGLIFLIAVVFTIFTISQLTVPLNNWIADGSQMNGGVTGFNAFIGATLVRFLLFAPVIFMLMTGYLILESHSLGLKFSVILSVIFLIAMAFRITDMDLVLFSGTSCILATSLMFVNRWKNGKIKDQAIVTENVAKLGLRLSGLISIVALFGLIGYIAFRGSEYISWNFITGNPENWSTISKVVGKLQPGSIGGIKDSILGSMLMVGLCEAIAIPLGLGSAIFLAEYAPDNQLTSSIRFCIETLAGAPSVVIGIVGITYFVLYLNWGYSLAAGGLSLAIMILPWNIRTAEESIRAVPQAYREGAYALGATKWQAIKKTVLLSASPGVVTGILLGIGAAIGETAIVMFTAGGIGQGAGSFYGGVSLTHEMMPNLAVWIYDAISNITSASAQGTKVDMSWAAQGVACAGALVLLMIFLSLSIGALILRNYLAKKTRNE